METTRAVNRPRCTVELDAQWTLQDPSYRLEFGSEVID